MTSDRRPLASDDDSPLYRRGPAPPRRRAPRARLRQAALVVGATALLLCPFLAYVWAHVQIVATGYQITAAEERVKALEQDNRRLRFERARLESLETIEARARKLGLVPVPPSRVVIVAERAAPPVLPSLPAATPAPRQASASTTPAEARR